MKEGETDAEGFATAICCIDGRVQEAVTEFARTRFSARWVDMATKPGAVASADESIHSAVTLSIRVHKSRGIVVSAHSECVANEVDEEEQKSQCRALARALAQQWSEVEVVPIWLPIGGKVEIL